ncbi:hypothetical protein [Marivirga aurantiaca]|nr:hypothetical protein [Marivirga aurantiaca]
MISSKNKNQQSPKSEKERYIFKFEESVRILDEMNKQRNKPKAK